MVREWKGLIMPTRVEWDNQNLTPTYGKFIIEPLERGYGTTIGNSLRRVLLSSLTGVSITSVRIEGVLHEFSTIPGVVEDTTEIILNLKQVILKLHSPGSKTIRVKLEGEREVTAGDIISDSQVEVLNPHLHIATLGKGAKLEMEMEVSQGKGYVPAEEHKKEDSPLGTIPIDVVFSPLRKVNFTVENARVGQKTNYDRLILEVWTNGSITPQDAVKEAADILLKHFAIVINPEVALEEGVKEISEEEKKRADYLKKSVNELELSVRAANCLKAAQIKTIGELVEKTDKELLQYRNFGRKSLNEIKEILNKMGLSLKPKEENTERKENPVKKDKGSEDAA